MYEEDDPPIPLFSIVPAQPDWYVAVFIAGGSEDGETWLPRFDLEPIIAWKIEHGRFHHMARRKSRDRFHHVDPIAVDYGDMSNIGNDWMIKRPDGKYQSLADRTFDNEAEALEYLQAEHVREQERLAKKRAKEAAVDAT